MPESWPAWLGPVWRWTDRNARRIRRTLAGLGDARRVRRAGLEMIPPARLRDRVHGWPDIRRFVVKGERTRDRIEAALRECGRALDSFDRILDFGCGCGRVIRWLAPLADRCEIHGTDTDGRAIAWCAENIPFARFGTNRPLPPLEYPDSTFGLVYAISVLTHLDEERQLAWLPEFRRITRPGGLVVVSILGRGAHRALRDEEREHLREHGLVHLRTGRWRGMFPDWYQATVHDPAYARELFSRHFELAAYLPGGLTKQQDLAVLRRADGDPDAPGPCSSRG